MSSQGNDRARDCSIARTNEGAAMEGGSAGKHIRSDLISGVVLGLGFIFIYIFIGRIIEFHESSLFLFIYCAILAVLIYII